MNRDYDKSKFTLITNLEYIYVQGPLMLRANASALLLQESPAVLGEGMQFEIRAFGPDAAWPVFDFRVPTLDYEIEPAQTKAVFIGSDDKVKPLGSGSIMKFAQNGPVLQLWAANDELPLDVEKFEGNVIAEKVWPALQRKAIRYWTHPAMPVLLHTPVPHVEEAMRKMDQLNLHDRGASLGMVVQALTR